MTTKMTRSELQHALACEDVSEGLREVIDDLWQRAWIAWSNPYHGDYDGGED